MKAPKKLWITVFLLGVAGTALLIFLVARQGWADVAHAVATAGWGLAVVVAFHIVPIALDAIAWGTLFPDEVRPPLRTLLWMRWIGESINTLLPSSQVGGDIIRARLASLRGVPVSIAAASVIVGITLNVATQIIFTMAGMATLAVSTGQRHLVGKLVLGAVLAVVAVGGFYVVQRCGIFRLLAKLVSKLSSSSSWQGLVEHGEQLDEQVRGLYARRRAVIISGAWSFISWVVGAVEVWIALWAIGMPASFAHAFILESVGQGIRSAMFLVPGALGVHEAGYVGVGKLLGIPGNSALALALIRRVRELVFGVPGLIAWQWVEGRRLLRSERVTVVVEETQAETVSAKIS